MKGGIIIKLLLMVVIVVIAFTLDIVYGSIDIPLESVIDVLFTAADVKESWRLIIIESRLPKALTAIICGIGLSVSGLQMQTLFRNPLAGPYILGISSGAGLGVALVTIGAQFISIPFNIATSSWLVIGAAIAGSSLVMVLIFWTSMRVKDIMTVLILGVMLAAIINAVISVFQYFSADAELKSFVMWTFGSLDAVSIEQVYILFPIVLVAVLVIFLFSKSLNLLLLGDAYAMSMGVKIIPVRLGIIITTGVLAGGITAFCGPIGFIGIVVPHICRLLFQTSDHRLLIPASALMGAIFMLVSDLIAHLPGSDGILPINSVTAILGIPFILWMLFGNKNLSKSF